VRTIGFAILGLLLSVIGLAHLDPDAHIKPQSGLIEFARYIASYPIIVFGITFIISVVAGALERRLVRVEKYDFFRGWQSLGQPFSRVLVGYSMIVVGLALIGAATAFVARYQSIFAWIYIQFEFVWKLI
jgi:hypothetical protein